MSQHHRKSNDRRGNIIVLSCFLMVAMLGMVAFGLDVGYLGNSKAELQRAADASALAGAYRLINFSAPSASYDPSANIANARSYAVQYAAANTVCRSPLSLNSGEIAVGAISTPTIAGTPMTFDTPSKYNAVQVTANRSATENGEVPLFFGKIFGRGSAAATASATAAVVTNFSGFQMPSDGSNLEILPFAFDQQTWNSLMQGNGTDQYSFDPTTGHVRSGSDGIVEGNLYPQGTGAPGNRGTVDIGSPNNSTADINRQILYGPNASDLAYLGGSISFNGAGTLLLNGDTGISAGVSSNLTSIIGQPRIVPIFSSVSGPGNNAQYTIVKFVSVRILQVQLTGKLTSKSVIIQPTGTVAKGGIPATTSTQTSEGVFSLPFLVR